MPPRLSISARLGEQVALEMFDANRHPAFQSEMSGQLSALQAASFVLTNISHKAVTAIAVRYNFNGPQTGHQASRYFTDSYTLAGFRPVSPANGKMLIAPRIFLPEALAGRIRIGAQLETGRRETVALISNASDIVVQVDSVSFSDGEIVGANDLKFPQEITARHFAAKQVAAAIKNASITRRPMKEVLIGISARPIHKDDVLGRWIRNYATEAAVVGASRDFLTRFDNMPAPPAWWSR